jgi:hypothetical protein
MCTSRRRSETTVKRLYYRCTNGGGPGVLVAGLFRVLSALSIEGTPVMKRREYAESIERL